MFVVLFGRFAEDYDLIRLDKSKLIPDSKNNDVWGAMKGFARVTKLKEHSEKRHIPGCEVKVDLFSSLISTSI